MPQIALLISIVAGLLLTGCGAGKVAGDPDHTAFAQQRTAPDRGTKDSHFKQRNSSNPKDNRIRPFRKRHSNNASDLRNRHFTVRHKSNHSNSTDSHFAQRNKQGNRAAKADAFSAPRRKRGLKYSKDHFANSVRSNGPPVDDCFSSKVQHGKRSALTSDPFANKRNGGFKGNYSDGFSNRSAGRFSRNYKQSDAFSKQKRGIRRKNFIGERPAIFTKRDKRQKRKKKGHATFTRSRKAQKAEAESRNRSPEMDLFRGRVLRKSNL